MNKNVLAILLVVSMIPGIIVITSLNSTPSITGNIVANEYTALVCSTNSDCSNAQVCCQFNDKNSGACSEPNKCSQIFEVTKTKTLKEFNPTIESPTQIVSSTTFEKFNNPTPIAIFFGCSTAILFIAIVYLILLFRDNKAHKKQTASNIQTKNGKTTNHIQSKLSSKQFESSKNKLKLFITGVTKPTFSSIRCSQF